MIMRRILLVWFLTVLLCTTVFPVLLPPVFRPDLFAILLIFISLTARRDRVFRMAWLTGFLRDIVSGAPLGTTALLYLIASAILLRGRRSLDLHQPLPLVTAAFLIALSTELLTLPLYALPNTYGTLVLASLATGATTPIAIWLLDRIKGWLGLRQRPVFGLR
jgi:rod shape-determining protein MreD